MCDVIENYHEAVRYVESFSNTSLRNNFGIDKKDPSFFLNRTHYFLDLLNNPEKGFSYIHITGTAGKGTVSHMLQEVLVASGKRTGLFTSPYVTTTIEKIRVDDLYIDPQEFINLVEYLKPFILKAQKGPFGVPSAFELFFTIALLHFKKQRCEWIVLEVGLGGRYDATNIITNPIVTAITNIDYDHTEILGNTLREIATDKAGIIKPGSCFFTSEQRPALLNIFEGICKKMNVDFHAVRGQSDYSSYNRELVKAIAKSIGISDECVVRGIQSTKLPCRFEMIQEKPTVILDGAHNRAKIRSTISNIKKLSFRKLYLIVAIADSKKDHQAILEPLLSMPYPMHVVFTQVKMNERTSVAASFLLSLSKKFKRKDTILELIEEAHDALSYVLKIAVENDVVVVTGSFFLAGELRKRWFSEEWILKHQKSYF